MLKEFRDPSDDLFKMWFRVFTLLVLLLVEANAGAWVQKRGHGILIAGLNRYYADERFSLDGVREPLGP
ncbi:MAG: hypothetical protein ACP5UT_18440, partial [Bryobacteraceae bacterium]